jgi:hypothetical protein
MKTQYQLHFKFAENGVYQAREDLFDTLAEARAATHLGNPAEAYADESEWQSVNQGTWFLNKQIEKRMGRSSPWLITEEQVPENDAERIHLATELALCYGMTDGAHHKQWVIDQMLRILLGDKYAEFVALDDGDEDEYEPWDEGIAP